MTLLARLVEPLLADAPDVRDVAPLSYDLPASLAVVTLVQAQVLGRSFSWLRSLDHHGVERCGQELVVAHGVRPGDHHGERSSVGLDDETALRTFFGPIGGVGADEVPPKRALPIAPSAACHSQSTPPSSSQPSISAAQIRSKPPSSTHRCKARCTEESSVNSFGRRFH